MITEFETRENTLAREMADTMYLRPHDPIGWHKRAKCAEIVEELETPQEQGKMADKWFPDDRTPENSAKIADTAQICWTCPVRQQCMKYGIDTQQEVGIWGGWTANALKAAKYDYNALRDEKNPYETEDVTSPYHRDNLRRAGRSKKNTTDQAAA